MCADINYVLVVPITPVQATKPEYFNLIPYVITYTDDTIRMKDLMEQYLRESEDPSKLKMHFSLSGTFRLEDELSIRALKKNLGRTSLNGLVLYVEHQFYYDKEDSITDSDEDVYID